MSVSSRTLQKAVSEEQRETMKAVWAFAYDHLSEISRRTGESYADHGCEVAQVLAEVSPDADLIFTAVLHDILVHPDGEKLLRSSPLSPRQRDLITKAHTLRRLHIDCNTKDLDTVIDAFLEDEQLLPLRMAHRLNDVRNIKRFPPDLRRRIAEETLYMYTAIAGRMGMGLWRHEMEDTCFRLLNPKIALQLQQRFEQREEMDKESLAQTRAFLKKQLTKHNVPVQTGQRIKGLYSSYRKMVLKKRRFEELTDRLAIRLIVESPIDCYKALGVVHACMNPIPGKLKDYIGSPKANGYQSIHTVVYPLPGVTEQPIEIQIRTAYMHEECEFGTIAHGKYKNTIYALNSRPARVNLFRNFQTLREESRTSKQFSDALLQYFREDHLAIFDADNNLYHMKKPLTALDFICHIWPQRISKLKTLSVNGRKRSMDTLLNDGDIVVPQFGRNKTIQRSWVNACKHSSSGKKIRELLKASQKS